MPNRKRPPRVRRKATKDRLSMSDPVGLKKRIFGIMDEPDRMGQYQDPIKARSGKLYNDPRQTAKNVERGIYPEEGSDAYFRAQEELGSGRRYDLYPDY